MSERYAYLSSESMTKTSGNILNVVSGAIARISDRPELVGISSFLCKSVLRSHHNGPCIRNCLLTIGWLSTILSVKKYK
jgi:hypothetical protein